jgi:hypothetical protein
VEQKRALRRGGVHLLGERAERNAARLQLGDRVQEMRQRPAQAIELPDHQTVTRADEREGLGQTRSVVAAAARPVLEQMTCIDAGGEQGITL